MLQSDDPNDEKGRKASHAPSFLFCNNDTLRKAMRALGQLYDEAIESTNLRSTQFGILVHIDELDEPTMRDLAHALVMDISSLSRSLQPLIRDGYVRLVANPEDGRSKRVTLSKAGERKLAEVREIWLRTQARFEDAFGAERARSLREIMIFLSSDKFTRAFRDDGARKPKESRT